MRKPRILLSLLAACMLTLSLTTSVFASVVENDWTEITNLVSSNPNPCNSEMWLHFNGKAHTVVTQTVDKAGGVHYSVNAKFSGTGFESTSKDPNAVNPGGIQYVALESDHVKDFNSTFDKNGAAVLIYDVHVNIVSKGPAPDIGGVVRTHTTINANGVVTSSVESFNLGFCKWN